LASTLGLNSPSTALRTRVGGFFRLVAMSDLPGVTWLLIRQNRLDARPRPKPLCA
jgi:hypothetical protein